MIIPAYPDIALLLLRLVAGLVFILHGRGKFNKEWAKGLGLPRIAGVLAGIGMVFGGLGVIFGLLTQIAAIGPLLVMLGAAYFHKVKWKHPFFNPKGPSYEFALVLALVALLFVLTGAGAYSIDALIGLYP